MKTSRVFPALLAGACILGTSFIACGPVKPPCGPTNCAGCCDSKGQCQVGVNALACGANGRSCTECAPAQVCQIGFCVNPTGTGGGGGGGSGSDGGLPCAATCAGCCTQNGSCIDPGNTEGACGWGGGACQVCTGAMQCVSFVCRDTTCSGCTGTDGGCSAGVLDSACGTGGMKCQVCQNGSTCNGAGVCSGGTCTGCRSPLGGCEVGNQKSLCGSGGASCQTCTGTKVCQNGSCVEPGGTDAGCKSFGAGCLTGGECCSGYCNASTLTCDRPPVDGGLDAGTDAGTRPGESCANAEPLSFSGGSASAFGGTSGYLNDRSSGCGGSGPDRVYSFTTSTTQDLTISLTTTSPSYTPVVYLVSGSCTTGTEVTCDSATSGGGSVTFTYPALPPGTYYLWIDGFSSSYGSYSLTANFSTSSVQGDTCSAPKTLTFFSGSASDTGTTSGAANDYYSSGCFGSGPDVVYTFTTTSTLDFSATVSTSTFAPALHLRGGSCAAGTEYTCDYSTIAGGSATITYYSLPAGTYYLFVDGYSSTSSGSYSLTASLTGSVATGDTCAAPRQLIFDGGVATDVHTTTGAANDYSSSGCFASGPDVVYTFTTTSTGNLTATVTPSTTGLRPTVYLRGSTCATGSEYACQSATSSGGTATLSYTSLPPGTYYLFVDGYSSTSYGGFTLSATLSTSGGGSGENCTSPYTLPLSGGSFGTATVTGTTVGHLSDTTTSCGGAGPDVVYTFATTTSRTFSATLTAQTTALDPVLSIRSSSGCSGTTGILGYQCGAAGGTASVGPVSLTAGTYYVWVDGFGSTQGAYSLSVNVQ
ncbi:MAG: PPC domain-containing protein [Myxococcales bacterium]|nr:PPC domain-containing protein [Myxococcales bacterium]